MHWFNIMNNNATFSKPASRTTRLQLVLGLTLAAILIAVVANYIIPPRWHPELSVKNTGTKAITIDFKGGSFVIQPDETWHNSFYAGDSLTLRATEAPDVPPLTIQLPERNPIPYRPIAQHWTADANADDPKNIRFEKRYFEEIREPRPAPQPWP